MALLGNILLIVLFVLLGLVGLAAVLIAALLIVPVVIDIAYREDALTVRARVLGIPLALYPAAGGWLSRRILRRSPEQQKRTERARKTAEKAEKKMRLGLTGLAEILEDVRAIIARLADGARRALTVRRLELAVTVGGGDAAAVALNYGKWCAALFPAVGVLTALIRTRRQTVTVTPDFLAPDTAYALHVRLTVRSWRLAGALLRSLPRIARLTAARSEHT